MKITKKILAAALCLLLSAVCLASAVSIQYGNQNDGVLKVQNRLKELGYFIGEENGFFGDRTQTAIYNFQKANGIEPTGLADSATMQLLYAESAVTKAEYIESLRKATVIELTLKPGDSGKEVRRLQSALFMLGYFSDEVTGNYGSVTEEAVCMFQLVNRLPVTGIADSATITLLISYDAIAANAYENRLTIQFGDVSSDVKQLQESLRQLGYFTGDCTGKFGKNTQEAVIEFQKVNGLQETGKCDAAMRILLIRGNAVSKSEAAAREAVMPLKEGDKSDAVVIVKQQLNALGYFNGMMDAEFTHALSEAVYYFQLANDLQTNGKADSATRLLLNSGEGKSWQEYSDELSVMEAALGSSGYHVVLLQNRLNTLGYYGGAFTGTYDKMTENAVRIFQRGHQLPETGVADRNTREIMNSADALRYDVAEKLYYERRDEQKRLEKLDKLVANALNAVAAPYEAGLVGPDKYGNAGLVYALFETAGVKLQPTLTLQYENAVSLDGWNTDYTQMTRGQQVFLKKDGTLLTGICTGEDMVVYASPEFERVIAIENILETDEYEFIGSISYL